MTSQRSIRNRFARYEGQVHGIGLMVEHGERLADILNQVLSVQEALRAAARELLRAHIHAAALSGDAALDLAFSYGQPPGPAQPPPLPHDGPAFPDEEPVP